VPGPMAPAPHRMPVSAPPPPRPVADVKPAPAKPSARALRAKALQARALQAKADTARLARVARAKHAAQLAAEARAEAKAERLAKAQARRDRIHAHQVELARAAAPPAPKPRHGLAILAHAFAKLTPHHARPEPADTEDRAEARPDRRGRKASAHETRLARSAPKVRPVRQDPTPLTSHGAGPLRLASTSSRCASPDPGAALACGDPSLGAAERRLARAYRDAEAAGVPSATLQQQQQRWIAARAAAAREAPWAVREVYQARIAELQDLTRDAKGD
jgi:hypothetical protein